MSWYVKQYRMTEQILPAARLLDTVESKLKDYNLTHPSSPPLWQVQIVRIVENKKKTETNSRLKEYTTPVFLESDRINWSNQEQYKNLQTKQVGEEGKSDGKAEEEAETDDEMIEYGVKVASKTVKSAVRSCRARDWSLRSRIEYYRNSVARLRETNRKRGRWSVCWNSVTRLTHPTCPPYCTLSIQQKSKTTQRMADFLEGDEKQMMESVSKNKEEELYKESQLRFVDA